MDANFQAQPSFICISRELLVDAPKYYSLGHFIATKGLQPNRLHVASPKAPIQPLKFAELEYSAHALGMTLGCLTASR